MTQMTLIIIENAPKYSKNKQKKRTHSLGKFSDFYHDL